MSDAIELKERASREEYELTVYEAVVGDALFAYFYVTPETHSLAWMAPEDFRFTGAHTCDFIEYQFSKLSPGEIELLDEKVPMHRSRKVEPRKPFAYARSVAYLMFADEAEEGGGKEEDEGFRTYDFTEEEDQNRYRALLRSDAAAHVLFARFDFSIVTYRVEASNVPTPLGQFDCCFTSENRRGTSANGWELAVNLPKHLTLEERTLKWIARNHRDRKIWRKLDFEKSLISLYERLGR